jgi:hypothetical protein
MSISAWDKPRERRDSIQRRLNQTIDDIRSNKAYSPQGRRAEMAKVTLQANKETQALKAEFIAERESRRESLEKRLFGLLGTPTPTELMVMRDSRDRAATLESAADAELKLKLANQAGDTFLAKAIAQVAATKGWPEVVNSYAETAPLGTRTALEELAGIPAGSRTNIADAATFAIRPPQELGTTDDYVLEAIASGDDRTAETWQAMTSSFNPGLS